MKKVKQIIEMIRGLSLQELTELNQELRKLGLPPVEPSIVGAKPKYSPPSLSAGAAAKPENDEL